MYLRIGLKRSAKQICTPYREVGENADEPESPYCLGCGGLNDEQDVGQQCPFYARSVTYLKPTEALPYDKCNITGCNHPEADKDFLERNNIQESGLGFCIHHCSHLSTREYQRMCVACVLTAPDWIDTNIVKDCLHCTEPAVPMHTHQAVQYQQIGVAFRTGKSRKNTLQLKQITDELDTIARSATAQHHLGIKCKLCPGCDTADISNLHTLPTGKGPISYVDAPDRRSREHHACQPLKRTIAHLIPTSKENSLSRLVR